MTIKHILLPLTGHPSGADAAVYGLALAKALGAHVTAGYEDELGPLYLAPDYGGSVSSYSDFFAQMEKIRGDRRKQARTYFDRAVKATSLPIVSAPVCEQGSTMWLDAGQANDTPISAFGGLTDLVVLDAPGDRNTQPAWNVVEDALFSAHRPTLIVPSGTKSVNLSTALIAWNGSPEAATAVEHALDLLPTDARIIVLQVGELKPGRMSAEKLIDYLGWHCRAAELHTATDREDDTSQIILHQARHFGAGLIIMGAYTHSRTREALLGGVTEFMLRKTPLPILMAH